MATADEMLDPDDSYCFAKDLSELGVESPVYVAQGMVSRLQLQDS